LAQPAGWALLSVIAVVTIYTSSITQAGRRLKQLLPDVVLACPSAEAPVVIVIVANVEHPACAEQALETLEARSPRGTRMPTDASVIDGKRPCRRPCAGEWRS
jgi:hypothetical protein